MSQPTFGAGAHGEVPFLSRPYTERQQIVVVDDALAKVVKAEGRAEQQISSAQAATAERDVDWHEKLRIGGRETLGWRAALPAAAGAIGLTAATGAATVGALVALPILGGIGVALGARQVNRWRKVKQLREQGFGVLTVGRSDAKSLSFPAGHPRGGILYIGNPAAPRKYYPAAQFHRLTFEDKLSEAIRLLMFLGATQMKVEHVRGWSREFSSTLDVPLGTPEVQVGAKAGSAKESKSQILFEATLTGTESPFLPKDLAWYQYETTWQRIAEGRLELGLKRFSLAVAYEDDFGVNAGLKLAVSEIGIDMGGEFGNHQSTLWHIVGEFRD